MTTFEFQEFWVPACTALKVTSLELDVLIGSEEWSIFNKRMSWEDTPLPENLKQLLVMLAGPHGPTILRAYRAKHDIRATIHD